MQTATTINYFDTLEPRDGLSYYLSGLAQCCWTRIDCRHFGVSVSTVYTTAHRGVGVSTVYTTAHHVVSVSTVYTTAHLGVGMSTLYNRVHVFECLCIQSIQQRPRIRVFRVYSLYNSVHVA